MKKTSKTAISINVNGLGDILMLMKIIQYFHSETGERYDVFAVDFPDVIQTFPYVNKVYHISEWEKYFSRYEHIIPLFDLQLAQEKADLDYTKCDIIDLVTISLGIGQLCADHKVVEYYPVEPDRSSYYDVILNTSMTWKTRSWPIEYWQKLCNRLLSKGYTVAVVGKNIKAFDMEKTACGLDGAVDLTNKLSLDQTFYTINQALLLVTGQNGLSVLSGATQTNVIVFQGPIPWSLRAVYRNNPSIDMADLHYKMLYLKGDCPHLCGNVYSCPVFDELKCIPSYEKVEKAVLHAAGRLKSGRNMFE